MLLLTPLFGIIIMICCITFRTENACNAAPQAGEDTDETDEPTAAAAAALLLIEMRYVHLIARIIIQI